MGILDSFYFVLKADSKDAVAGITKAGEAFDDLKRDGVSATNAAAHGIDRLGQVATTAGSVTTRAIGSITEELRGLILPAGAAVAALGSVSAAWERIQGSISTANNAQSLNIPVDQYDAYAKVLQSVGYEADETRDLFVDLAEAIGEGASDAESQRAKTFKELGVSLKDANGNIINATQGFQSLSKAIDGMAPEKAIFLIRQLGINDPKMLTLLTQGNKELESRLELVRRNGVMTAEQARAAQDLQREQQRLAITLGGIGDAIARGLLPYVAGLFKALNEIMDYVNRHKVAFSIFFGTAATIIGASLIPAILRATAATMGWATATIAATWPWLALAAAVAAVSLAAEDLYLYFTDPTANTVTGELVKKFPQLADFLAACRAEIVGVINEFISLKDQAMETFDNVVDYINSLNPAIDKLIDKARNVFGEFFDWFKSLGLAIGDFFRDMFAGIINSVVDSIPEAAQKALGISRMRTGAERRADENGGARGPNSPGGADMAVPGDVVSPPTVPSAPAVAAGRVLSQASSAPINGLAGSGAAVNRTVNNNGGNVSIEKVEVHTQSTDPQAINSAIVEGLQGELRNAVAQHDDGISH